MSDRKSLGAFRAPTALALQGGGTFGAFAWGVLDRLLDEDFRPAGLSGASAGAINAVLVAWGLQTGGRDGAKAVLRRFWESIGKMGSLSPLGLPGAALQFDLLSRVASPYQLNPLNINPMRDLLADLIDFDVLRAQNRIPLFISTTDVSTGDQRIFREHEISLDVLMASSCIPYLHQAVEIDGHTLWDGGFSSNPPILPLVLETHCRSILVVKLTPDEEPRLPTHSPEIFSRFRRMAFNTPLLRELDAMDKIHRLLGHAVLLPNSLRRVRDLKIHRLAISADFFASTSTGMTPKPAILEKLFDAGRDAAEAMLTTETSE